MNKLSIFTILITLLAVTIQNVVAEEESSLYIKAGTYFNNGKYLESAEVFKMIRGQDSAEGEKATFAYALSQEEAEDIEQAKEGYQYFITHYPHSDYLKVAQNKLINLLIQNGDYAQAEFFLYTAQEGTVEAVQEETKELLIIFCYRSLAQYRNAQRTVSAFIKKYPDSDNLPVLKLWLAWYFKELHNSHIAEELYYSIINSYGNGDIARIAKADLVGLLVRNNNLTEAVRYMLELIDDGYPYSNAELLWLAKYFADIRELATASDILNLIIENPRSAMYQAIAIKDLAQVQTEDRKFHDALSNFPLVSKALLNSNSTIAKIELLRDITDYSNAQTLRKIGRIASANAILSKLDPEVFEPLYYKILYEQGLVAFKIGRIEEAAKKLMQVGILAEDPDLSGRALLECYEASKAMNNAKLMKVCLEELSGKNEGSYGMRYPNSPYTAQAFELMESK